MAQFLHACRKGWTQHSRGYGDLVQLQGLEMCFFLLAKLLCAMATNRALTPLACRRWHLLPVHVATSPCGVMVKSYR